MKKPTALPGIIPGVVYILIRPGTFGGRPVPSCEAVFRPLRDNQFRPRRRFPTLEAGFRFLTRELGIEDSVAAHTLEAGVPAPLYVQLSEDRLQDLWPDWRQTRRPMTHRLPALAHAAA